MRVEAIKVAEGFLIPFEKGFPDLPHEKVVMDVEIVEPLPPEADYSALDQLVGLCDTKISSASVQHDERIYRR
ncbi:MAG: hypothetical protein A3F84_28765 [Candidatus Handelsmanbacteria bacterium RIFCSPLOWO2_12_FULL_64_10]|uniref:Uncharacterized protein n=1 Tax=Handelsmanbacteria sp. (strain RIFCSPLOWO2_12_FULL_64_10) TaxID=1817868 RepID=A0A1F6C6F3_HANXR|nr:MAG: hypothetical protein A3F84_28765 [Candidatus Handelsmanbacteria bacterium RIFCSPLOWO2_12_FULL_64_10]